MLGPAQKDTRTQEQIAADKAAFVAKLQEQEKAAIERARAFQERLKNQFK